MRLGHSAAESIRHPGQILPERTDEKNRGSTGSNERQAPLQRHRRRRQRLGHNRAENIDLLLFGATANNSQIRKVALESFEKAASARLRLDQRHRALGKGGCQRYSRRSSTRADIGDRALETFDERYRLQAV